MKKLIEKLKEIASNCGDNRGRDGEYLDSQISEAIQLDNTKSLTDKLQEIAAQECWDDKLMAPELNDVNINDFAGGNIDDAYSGGHTSGRVQLARELIKFLKQ